MDRKELLDRAAKMRWFHALDFGDCQTAGRFPEGTPQNRTLYGVMDLLKNVNVSGLDCLDIGTAHGVCAFNMASRGGRVVATDINESSPPFEVAQQVLGLDVDYRARTNFDNIVGVLGSHRFDVIVCAGVLYHMLNPFDSILKCRRLLKPNGILVFETAYDPEAHGAVIDFNPQSGKLKEVYTYWVPSRDAVLGMLRFTGFNIYAVRTTLKPSRIAAVAQSVALEAVAERTDMMARLHDAGVQDPTFPGQPPIAPLSPAQYSGPHDDVTIDWNTYRPDFYPHPSGNKPTLGSTTWRAKDRNF